MFIFKSLGAVCLGAASRILKSKFEKTAAVVVVGVVGIGLLADPVNLPDDPSRTGFPEASMNVCAPVVSSITVTDDGSAGFRVSVDFSHGWDMFRWVRWAPLSWKLWGYDFGAKDAVRHNPLKRGNFWNSRTAQFDNLLWTADSNGRDVHFDYFSRGGTGGKYFEMAIEPQHDRVVNVAGKEWDPSDHYVNLTLYVTDRDSKGRLLPGGEYRMHCWVSDSDGNGYYVTVYFGDEAFF